VLPRTRRLRSLARGNSGLFFLSMSDSEVVASVGLPQFG
jgi:hypothetical protein